MLVLRRAVAASSRRWRHRMYSMDAFLEFEREMAQKKRAASPPQPPRTRRFEPPTPPREDECCNLNCPNCVLLVYNEQLLEYEDSVRWDAATNANSPHKRDAVPTPDVSLTWATPAVAMALARETPVASPPRGVTSCPVVVNRVLTETPHRSVHHVDVNIAPQEYHTACNWNVYVPNSDALVSRCLDRLALPPEATTTPFVQVNPGHSKTYPTDEWLSLTSLLTWFVDLASTPKPRVLRLLSAYATAPADQARLIELAADVTPLSSSSSLVDVLEEFESITLSAEAFLSLAPPLFARSYTVASSSKSGPTTVAMTVAVKAPPLHGRCSTHLASTLANASHIYGSVAPSSFSEHWRAHFPPTTPQLWIATGSGIAPFRGLLQELAPLETRPPVALYFGCRDPVGELYQSDLQAAVAQQVLASYTPVYSQQPPPSHPPATPWHVGDKLKQDAATVCDYLERGTVYVCGSLAMGRDVKHALVECLAGHRGWSHEKAKAFVTSLQQSGRYVAEVW